MIFVNNDYFLILYYCNIKILLEGILLQLIASHHRESNFYILEYYVFYVKYLVDLGY